MNRNSFNEKILKKEYTVEKILKNDNRSEVLLINIENERYIYKIPKEKNSRKWQRFLSIFRGSESKREYFRYKKILKNDFLAPTPISYYEKREYGFVVFSFLVIKYIEGEDGKIEHLDQISKKLKEIHKKGFLHGDSQLSNFRIKNDDVYLIDAKLQKNIYGKAGEIYEFIYLEESCYKDIDVYEKHGIAYSLAKGLNNYLHWFGNLKKRLKRNDEK